MDPQVGSGPRDAEVDPTIGEQVGLLRVVADSRYDQCLTMYFMPASLASRTQASASNLTGLNWSANLSYSSIGILALVRIHSA